MLYSERRIPKSLKDCYATDYVSSNLWNWSNQLESWGRIILVILIIIGIISTIGQAVLVAEDNVDFVFLTVITSIATWTFYAFIEYCVYHVLSLLIASLATIVQNTRITANVAIYNAAKEEGNPNGETGYSSSKLDNERTSGSTLWICKECGTKNAVGNVYCVDCGKHK